MTFTKLIYLFFGAIIFLTFPNPTNASTELSLMNTSNTFTIGFSLSDLFSLFIKDEGEDYWVNKDDLYTYKERYETDEVKHIFFSWWGRDSGGRDEDKDHDWDKDYDWDWDYDEGHDGDDDEWRDGDKWDGRKNSSKKIWWRYYCY